MSEKLYSINQIFLGEDSNISDVEVLRAGVIRDRNLKITEKMLQDFVKNDEQNVYGTELQVNLNHERGSAAAGWIKRLFIDPQNSKRLMATVEWTKLGVENIKDNLYKFVSAEFSMEYPHHKTGKTVKNVFSGLALTNTPALKGQKPIALEEIINELNENNTMLKTWIEKLRQREFVSKEDKELARELLEEAPEEEREEVKDAVAEVEAKPEQPEEEKVEEPEEEAPAPEAAPAEELSEKMTTLSEENNELREKVQKLEEAKLDAELSESFNSALMLSEDKAVGFVSKDKDRVVSFMKKLGEEDRAEFMSLLSNIKSVDLHVYGGEGVSVAEGEGVTAEDTKLAEERAAKSGKPVHEELAQIYSERV